MTRIQRRLLIDTSVIGVSMTLFVVALFYFTRVLASLDDWFYDRRAALCQFFTPPPTDKLVHVDIDDQALATLGQWPWPRAQFAQLIDEINDAGAKAIFMDIIFSEPSNPSPRIMKIAPGKYEEIDDDGIFAAALRRADNCLVPPALRLFENPSAVYQRLRDYLTVDLELNEGTCFKRLLDEPAKVIPPGTKFPADLFLGARREAMNARVSAEVAAADAAKKPLPTFDELRARLLPRTDPDSRGSPLLRLLRDELDNVLAARPIHRFMLPIPPGLPHLVRYASEQAPILSLSQAAAYSGSVDYLPDADASGTVRTIPLWCDYRGKLFPQTDLVLACAVLGVDIRTVRVEPDRVTIPKPPGRDRDIVIPVRSVFLPKFGHDVGMFMDVPVRGTTEWEFIFDHKRFRKAELHLPITAVSDVHAIRQRIARNNANLDRALEVVLAQDETDRADQLPRVGLDAEKWKAYAANRPAPSDTATRRALVAWTLKELNDSGFIALATQKDDELPDARERVKRDEFAAALKNFTIILEQNKRFDDQLATVRGNLRERIGGRAVMIGWTATARTDFVTTAIQPRCPGVIVHGLVFNAIMTEHFWRHAPKWVTACLIVVMGLLVTAANGLLKPSTALIVTVCLGAAYLLVNGLVLFDYGHWCVGVAGPMVALGSAWATGALAGFLIEATERTRITKRFSSYVDQKLVDHVIENPDAALDGQVREMSVVFTDLAGFTTLSEQLRERTVPILSDYLGRMVPIIRRHDGYVNKFLGDGIMCFYNAPNDDPDHAAHAVRTVLEMQVAMNEFAREMVERGLPDVSMRCGVSTGLMVVGDSGPVDAADYTVLGDNVNFASRLEGANKVTGTRILISQRTSELIGDQFLLRPVGRLLVVGKSEGVMTYEPLAPIDEATPQDRIACAMCAEMISAYTVRDFAKCMSVADQMDMTFGQGKLTALYRTICQTYLIDPPGDDFVGNLILTEK